MKTYRNKDKNHIDAIIDVNDEFARKNDARTNRLCHKYQSMLQLS